MTPTKRDRARQEIKEHTKAYLASGGKIQKLPSAGDGKYSKFPAMPLVGER